METVFFSIIGIIIGGITSFWAGKYYFKKGVKQKSLTPFLQFSSEILADIDDEVRKKLKVSYDKKEVSDLYQVQFVIANTGDFPIRDCISPLSLDIPQKGEVLDVGILHIEPAGRQVTYELKKTDNAADRVSFSFPLLNSSEYFITKLLIRGKLPVPEQKESSKDSDTPFDSPTHYDIAQQFTFTITVDDLPPSIKAQRLPFQYEIERYSPSIDWSAIATGLGLVVSGTFLGLLFYSFNSICPNLYILNKVFWTDFSMLCFSTLVGWAMSALLMIAGFALAGSEITDLRTPEKPKFKIPSTLSRRDYPFIRMHR